MKRDSPKKQEGMCRLVWMRSQHSSELEYLRAMTEYSNSARRKYPSTQKRKKCLIGVNLSYN